MSILQITTDTTGQIDVNPRNVKIISSASLNTVLTPGYLNPLVLQGYTIFPSDIIQMWYGATSVLSPGIFNIFTPSINADGVITLETWRETLPVFNNHIALFDGTSGLIKDSGTFILSGTQTTTINGVSGSIFVPGATDSSIAMAGIVSTENSNIFLQLVATSTNLLTLSFNQAPGSVKINYLIFNMTLS